MMTAMSATAAKIITLVSESVGAGSTSPTLLTALLRGLMRPAGTTVSASDPSGDSLRVKLRKKSSATFFAAASTRR